MKPEKVKALLPLIGSEVTGQRGQWIEGRCPYALWRHDSGKDRNPSFGVKSEKHKKSIYKCWSCGKGGDLMHLHTDLNFYLLNDDQPQYQMGLALQLIANEQDDIEFDPDIPDYAEDGIPDIASPYPEEWLESFKSLAAYKEGRDYWRSRGLKMDLAEELDVRFDPLRSRVCFPFRDPKQRLMGMQGRDIIKDSTLRYYFYPYPGTKTVRNMHAWLGEDRVDFDKPVVVMEGPFDYASTYRVYKNNLASFSAGVSDAKLKRLGDASEIITFYDNGKGGDSARARIKKVIKGTPIIDVIPEKVGGDPGAMSAEEVRYHLEEYLPI